ncbi:MAG: hypothetical protein CL908_17745 [Deltaproteobacteria bacterium]|nr:hypothetical protein [Deltaproteobacteria bacterium]
MAHETTSPPPADPARLSPKPKPRRLLRKLLVLAASCFVALLVCEGIVRGLDGYRILSFELRRDAPPEAEDPVHGVEAKARIDALLAQAARLPKVNPGWFTLDPPEVVRKAIDPVHARRAAEGRVAAVNARHNLDYYRMVAARGDLEDRLRVIFVGSPPRTLWTFRGPAGGQPHPAYRYPANVTLPDGLTTNALGFRGAAVTVKKAPKTIRIACVGASTTVASHHFPWSYPEFMQPWLQTWINKLGLDVRIEVVNAGRDAIRPDDLAAIVRYEVLPLDPDYVLYYEGANSFRPGNHVKLHDGAEFGEAPDDLVPTRSGEDASGGLLSGLTDHSAIVRRLCEISHRGRWSGDEPPKPRQEIVFPTGFDEGSPKLETVGDFLMLDNTLAALDGIRKDAESVGARMIMTSYCFMVRDGLVLDLRKKHHRFLFAQLNRMAWPSNYANLRRLADVQNRIFEIWAKDRGIDFIPVADQMPLDPDLFLDVVHTTMLGTRLRAWCVFQGLIPILARDLEAGRVPRAPATNPPPMWRPQFREVPFDTLRGK